MQRVIRANLAAWRLELHSLEAIFPHDEAVINVAFSPDGKLIATASVDKTARLWDAATGEGRGIYLRHDLDVHEVAFSPDGSRILTAGYDKTARLWETKTGRHIRTLAQGRQIAGRHQATWHGLDAAGQRVPTGVYLYRVTARDLGSGERFSQTRKMVLLK